MIYLLLWEGSRNGYHGHDQPGIQPASKQSQEGRFQGPVFITDRGRPAHVLLTIEDYQRISEKAASIVESLAMPEATSVEFEPSRLADKLVRIPDLS